MNIEQAHTLNTWASTKLNEYDGFEIRFIGTKEIGFKVKTIRKDYALIIKGEVLDHECKVTNYVARNEKFTFTGE